MQLVPWMLIAVAAVCALLAWKLAPLQTTLAIALAVVIRYAFGGMLHTWALTAVVVAVVVIPFVSRMFAARQHVIVPGSTKKRDRGEANATTTIDAFVETSLAALNALGFLEGEEVVDTIEGRGATTFTFSYLCEHPDTGDRVALWALVGRSHGIDVEQPAFVTCSTRLENGVVVVTTNWPVPDLFPGLRGRQHARLPNARTVAALLRVHRARIAHARSRPSQRPRVTDWAAEVRAQSTLDAEAAVERHLYERLDEGRYRPTWFGAARLALGVPTPYALLNNWLVLREEQRLLKALGIDAAELRRDQPAAPSVYTLAGGPLASLVRLSPTGLLVSLLLLALYYPHAPLWTAAGSFVGIGGSRIIAVPDDFTVRPSFELAVADLERLTNGTAEPLRVRDDTGTVASEMRVVPLRNVDIETLTLRVARTFAEAGFLLFQTHQADGVEQGIALAPSFDPYVVMRRLGTNGDNFGIATDSVIAWFRATEREMGLQFTAIGFDYVAARIVGRVDDAERLARRYSQLCPEAAEGERFTPGAGRALARAGVIYCWWD